MSASAEPYKAGSLVLCKHTDNLYYEAKIIKVTQNRDGEWVYRLHYTGWNNRYDENIKHSATRTRFMEHNSENIEMTKQQKESTIALLKNINKKKRQNEDVASAPSSAKLRPKHQKPTLPSHITSMLQNVRNVANLEEKTSVDDFLNKYFKANKGKFGKLWPGYSDPDELAETIIEQLKRDFNIHLMTYLTQGELKQCLAVFNKKRSLQSEPSCTLEEMKEIYEKAESRKLLLDNPGVSFTDTYGVLHLARFIKGAYNKIGGVNTGFEKFVTTLFFDILGFAKGFTSEYTF
jgi:hypothetical protein